jgi:hypothetical protein
MPRALGAALLREAMAIRGELGLESYDRFFPAQNFMPKKGIGNLIALPLQGRCRRHRSTTVFLDQETLEPYEDQFAFLSSIRRLGAVEVVGKVEELQPPAVGPATRDNALAESFFSAIKGELLDEQAWPTRAAARHAITEYLAWYNGTRLHSVLGYKPPAEYETTTRHENLKHVA